MPTTTLTAPQRSGVRQVLMTTQCQPSGTYASNRGRLIRVGYETGTATVRTPNAATLSSVVEDTPLGETTVRLRNLSPISVNIDGEESNIPAPQIIDILLYKPDHSQPLTSRRVGFEARVETTVQSDSYTAYTALMVSALNSVLYASSAAPVSLVAHQQLAASTLESISTFTNSVRYTLDQVTVRHSPYMTEPMATPDIPNSVELPALTPRVGPMSTADFRTAYRSVPRTQVHPELFDVIPENLSSRLRGRDGQAVTFGLEIEIDFPDEHYNELGVTKRNLLASLRSEGLAFVSPTSRGTDNWHVAARRENPDGSVGYTTALNGWTVEFDRTVDNVGGARGCEIVSPVLYDTPSSWSAVSRVIELIKQHGGSVSQMHGLHVNIGVPDLVIDSTGRIEATLPEKLATLGAQYDDVLIRLGHTDEVGRHHRGRSYCRPVLLADHPLSLSHVNGHNSAINMTHWGRGTARRLEFRFFDGTLDAGRIQANVMLGMALMVAANNSLTTLGEDDLQPAGTHVRERDGSPRILSGEAWDQSTLRFRHFINSLQLEGKNLESAITMYRTSRWMVG